MQKATENILQAILPHAKRARAFIRSSLANNNELCAAPQNKKRQTQMKRERRNESEKKIYMQNNAAQNMEQGKRNISEWQAKIQKEEPNYTKESSWSEEKGENNRRKKNHNQSEIKKNE